MARRKSGRQQRSTLDGGIRPGDEEIPTRTLVDEVEAAFLEYSMSVIISRAFSIATASSPRSAASSGRCTTRTFAPTARS